MSESMSGVVPEIRLGSEPRRTEGAGGHAFGEATFVERALAILARQDRPPATPVTGAMPGSGPMLAPPYTAPPSAGSPYGASPYAPPTFSGPVLSQVAPAVSAVASPALASAAPPVVSPLVSSVASTVSPALSPFLPQAVPPFVPSSLAQATSGALTPGVSPAAPFPPALEALRKQAADWIDSLLALVTAGLSPPPVRTNLVAVDAGSSGVPASAPPPLPAGAAPAMSGLSSLGLRVAAAAPTTLATLAASGGQVAAATFRVVNDGAAAAPLRFIATDLVGDSGARIPASAVTFAPAASVVAAHAVRTLDLFVDVPAATPAGVYTGLLQLIGQPLERSLLVVDVKPAAAPGRTTTEPAPATRTPPGSRA